MTFQRFGRSYHLRIATAKDLVNVVHLDEALWVATSAPLASLNIDPVFLGLVDTDNNGRIMCFEIKEAASWLLATLRDTDGITIGSTSLHIDAVNPECEDGEKIRITAMKILERSDAPDSGTITLGEVRRIRSKLESSPVSEAGIALPQAAGDEGTRQFINDVIATVGGIPHPSGDKGVARSQLDKFLEYAKAYIEWHAKGAIPNGADKTDIMSLGSETPDAYDIYAGIRGKISQFFKQCAAVAFDERTSRHVRPRDSELEAADLSNPQEFDQLMKDGPLAQPNPHAILRFDHPLNPHYLSQLQNLHKKVVGRLLGPDISELSATNWERINDAFSAYDSWLNARPGPGIEKLPVEKLRSYIEGEFSSEVSKIIDRKQKTAFALENIRLTEKLLLYQAHMLSLLNNLVSFPHLYNPDSHALFEMGTLIIDGRNLNFAVKVDNRSEHSKVAQTSNIFLVYAEITPPGEEPKYELALPVTAGSKGNLCVGKRGIFLDISGRQLDARIVQIIENPISIREALVSPFQRLWRILTGKIEAITTAAEKKLDSTAVTALDASVAPASAPLPQHGKGLLAGGLLMGGGVAIAALGSAAAYITKTLAGIEKYKIVIAVLAALFAVIGPVSVVAMLKLRRRDLSAVLEGAGWAINARMRLSRRQARVFTSQPRIPALRRTSCPYYVWLIIAAAAVAFAVFIRRLFPCLMSL